MKSDLIDYYSNLGLDLTRLACGCSVKIDLSQVVYPAIDLMRRELSKKGIFIKGREDADVFPRYIGERYDITRRTYDIEKLDFDPSDLRSLDPDRAVVMTALSSRNSFNPDNYIERTMKVYQQMIQNKVSFTIGKGHSIVGAATFDKEFMVFDFINEGKGPREGYIAANNDTMQLIDPTMYPGSDMQIAVTISNALNDLLSMGIYESISIYPVFDAPTEEMIEDIRGNMERYARKYHFSINEQEPLRRQGLILGATVTGETMKEPPLFYNQLKVGDRVMVHRSFGDLAPITLYLAGRMSSDDYFDALGLDLREVQKLKDDVLEVISIPNIEIAKVIHKYSPAFIEEFSEDEHIKITGDISGPGIYVFKELARKANVSIELRSLPLFNQEHAMAASSECLIPDGTAGTNGAVFMIASPGVIEVVEHDLRHRGYDPQVIGEVCEKGTNNVHVSEDINDIVTSTHLLNEFRIGPFGS